MRLAILTVATTLTLLSAPAWAAADSDSPEASAGDTDYGAGVQAWKKKDWPQVLAHMSVVTQRDPNNADAWNFMGHAARQLGDMPNAFKHYGRALQINPKHRGAHEYIGEAYLMVGNLPKAEEHLKVLDKLCTLPCEEYTDLKAKVARYRAEHPA